MANRSLIRSAGAALLTGLMLSGCTEGDLDALIESTHQSSGQSVCSAQAAPFAHTLCSVSQDSLQQADSPLSLQLFWKSRQDDRAESDQNSALPPLYTFDALLADLPKSRELKFAINAGMYDREFAPIGYTVIQGKQILSLNLNEGAGNFHLLPNGVLWWDNNNQVQITESQQFSKLLNDKQITPWYATQSGPMLVIDDSIHPKFNQSSTSKKIRNGVGVCAEGQIQFVTSHEPVNFYQFADYFKQQLHCPNALFLDGGIASALYAPDTDHKDDKNMGVMLGLIEDKD
ncbi:hypothetical protein A6J60_010505 [Psychrobacter sp. FDAARGOS_221]|nr:hypothetical protein A6J60_010505 [Psychrobacter sp. FDAARGOS_221]